MKKKCVGTTLQEIIQIRKSVEHLVIYQVLFHQGHHVLQPLGCFALLFKNLQRIDNSLFQLISLNNVRSLDSAR